MFSTYEGNELEVENGERIRAVLRETWFQDRTIVNKRFIIHTELATGKGRNDTEVFILEDDSTPIGQLLKTLNWAYEEFSEVSVFVMVGVWNDTNATPWTEIQSVYEYAGVYSA